eukprot:401357-Alexandrium_andersonii.AAC.1
MCPGGSASVLCVRAFAQSRIRQFTAGLCPPKSAVYVSRCTLGAEAQARDRRSHSFFSPA